MKDNNCSLPATHIFQN